MAYNGNYMADQEFANLTTFQGFSERSYIDPLTTGYGFVFITAPQLFIDQVVNPNIDFSDLAYQNLKKDPRTVKYLQAEQFNSLDTEIVKMLSYNTTYHSTGFIPIFTNLCRGIDPTEITLDTTEMYQTTHGYRQSLPTNAVNSKAGMQLNIPFQETADMTITKIIELWVNYIENISEGTITPHPNSILNGEIDYLSDIYYLMLGPDGQTIKYFMRWTGCHPVNIPYSRLNYQKGDKNIVDIDITFNCLGGVEHMNPAILEEFNMASLRMNNTDSFNISGVVAMADDNDQDRFVIKDSILLNPEKLNEVSHGLASVMRNNPLVFCLSSNITGKSRYVLTFGSYTFEEDNEASFTKYMKQMYELESADEILSKNKLHYGTPYNDGNTDGLTSTGNPDIFMEFPKVMFSDDLIKNKKRTER